MEMSVRSARKAMNTDYKENGVYKSGKMYETCTADKKNRRIEEKERIEQLLKYNKSADLLSYKVSRHCNELRVIHQEKATIPRNTQ